MNDNTTDKLYERYVSSGRDEPPPLEGKKLTSTMLEAIAIAKKGDGTLKRGENGAWRSTVGSDWANTRTVYALINRGIAEYVEYSRCRTVRITV